MNFATSAYIYAGLLTLYAIIFVWLSLNAQDSPEGKSVISLKLVLFMFAVLYASLAHFSAVAGYTYSAEYANDPDCEWRLDNTTEAVAGEIVYNYTDTCAARGVYGLANTVNVLTIWAGFFVGFAVILASFWGIGRLFSRW